MAEMFYEIGESAYNEQDLKRDLKHIKQVMKTARVS